MSQLSLAAPLPVAAVWAYPQLLVQFDQPLLVQHLDPNNWFVRYHSVLYTTTSAHVLSDTVRLFLAPDESDPGLDVVNYWALVPDVRNMALVPAAPFENFPIG